MMQAIPTWARLWGLGKEETSSFNRISQTQMLQTLDKVCRVCLAAFAYLVAPSLFAVSFGVGALGAVGNLIYTQGGEGEKGTLRPFCGQGYMEFLSGNAFSPWVVRVVTTLFIGAHVRHDPTFFVPFSGVFIGWWAGSEIGAGACSLWQQRISHPPKIRTCPCAK